MKQSSFLIPLVVCRIALIAGTCPIDGYNTFFFSDSGYLADANLSYTSGDSSDPFYIIPANNTPGTFPLLHGVALLASETGDPLLNVFSSPENHDNRDHRTFGEIRYLDRRKPLSVISRYRYIDTYTDRFDNLWNHYGNITGSRMYGDRNGVNYESFTAARWCGSAIKAEGYVNRFDRWHATPYYFSPLFETGTAGGGNVLFRYKKVTFESVQHLFRSNWYYDHQQAVRYNDYRTRNTLSLDLGRCFSARLSGSYASDLEPSGNVTGGIVYSDAALNGRITVTTFANGTVDAEFSGSRRLGGNLICSLFIAHDYREKARSYHFLENVTTVLYRTKAFERNIISATATWMDTLLFPLNLSAWVFQGNRMIREQIDTKGDTIIISQVNYHNGANTFAGVYGNLLVTWKKLSFKIRPALMVPSGEREDVGFFIGKAADAELTLSSGENNPAAASLRLSYNDRPTLTYLIAGDDGTFGKRTYYAPANWSASLSCRMPFVFTPLAPFLYETAVLVSGGPLRLAGTTRERFHPRGNDFGPEFTVMIEASIR